MDYAPYDFYQVDTGIFLYRTHATQNEILKANNNLKHREENYRFFPAGEFSCPNICDPSCPS